MRIAELSRRSGVAVPTIKYYLREGLLPPGELTSPNQASYDEHHLNRLRLIRAMIDLAQVPVARVRAVLEALDSDTLSLHERIGAVHRAITPSRQLTAGDSARTAAAVQVQELIRRRGWAVEPDSPAIATLVETISVLRSLGQDHLVDLLDPYAEAVERFTELEVAAVASRTDPDQVAESVVIGTILGENLVASLRLLAQENISSQRLR
ncbi:MerR family transcriptional regulator [Micromonospora purpureochromogenes]|uniref:DNA-binding transcriptional MerR regulator n=1 Tax=Micromonospora purpureochromogenes TaxID=47872 RepID=A0ABX2RME4_9ACTN|nr:MerR family transcriptional regulator [Micromonospora purpureochromogenes]NYF56334.1 DNA-binding transcriptional MerR regulator [Micromonospora purpureochromogenes]